MSIGHQRSFRLVPVLLIFFSLPLFAEVPEAANWIANPSFETGSADAPVDWVFFNEHESTSGKWDAANARTGKAGVAVEGRGGMSFGRWITPYRIPLEPGAKYRVSFWYRGAGANVYVIGQSMQLTPDGKLTADISKRFKTTIAKPPAVQEWTRAEGEFTAPGYPSWAQLCLSGTGRETCSFDDITLVRPGLTLVAPQTPQVAASGTDIILSLYAPELAGADDVQWKVDSKSAAFESAKRNPGDGTWEIRLKATGPGVADIAIEAARAGGKPLRLELPRHLRVFAPAQSKMFAFAAITDAHFYRPGKNERNDKFALAVSSLNALDPLFVLSLGDQMEIHSGIRDEENKLISEAVKEQLGLLRMPVFTISGNHEIDRMYEGVGSQWYHQKYLAQPPFWSFPIGPNLFAGIDVSTPGIASREHGASFLNEAQAAWLENLLAAPRAGLTVLAGHISPFNEFPDTPDRDRLLALVLGKKVNVYLCGHTHYTDDATVPNGATAKPWPKQTKVGDPAAVTAALQNPDTTGILTTTTACAFMLGDKKTSGYRYVFVKEGKIAWQDVLPLTLAVQRESPSPSEVKMTMKNGHDKAIFGLPIGAILPAGRITATSAGKDVPVQTTALEDGTQSAWTQVDCPLDTTVEVTLTSKP